MEPINHLSPEFGTKLNDRFLWFDGDSTVSVDEVTTFMQKGLPIDSIFIDEVNEEVNKYNRLSANPLKIKSNLTKMDFNWNIPEEYKDLDLVEHITEKLTIECEGDADDIWEMRAKRIAVELKLYKELNLLEVLRTIIYVINTLEENNQVWGVGRGSSVSSYILYLIGVHDVDSIEYGLEITDFLRNE